VQLPAPTASTDVSAIAAMVHNEDSLFFCSAGALVDVSCETLFLLTNKQQRSTIQTQSVVRALVVDPLL